MAYLNRCVVGIVGAASVLCLGGCEETVDGEFLDTAGIAMVATATATSDSRTVVDIEFLVGGDESNTYVDLEDDEVFASAGDDRLKLGADDIGRYDAEFDVGAADTEFLIELDRADKDDAPESSGTLPEPFTMELDAQGEISRMDALTVTWEPSGTADEVTVDVDGDCIFYTFDSNEADDGSFTFPASEFVLGGDSENDDEGSCEATLTLTRTRYGDTDPAFDGESRFHLRQRRSITFTSVQ